MGRYGFAGGDGGVIVGRVSERWVGEGAAVACPTLCMGGAQPFGHARGSDPPVRGLLRLLAIAPPGRAGLSPAGTGGSETRPYGGS